MMTCTQVAAKFTDPQIELMFENYLKKCSEVAPTWKNPAPAKSSSEVRLGPMHGMP